MAKVRFKRGKEANLLSLVLTPADDGTFFLTTDTNRLYVCSLDVLKPVNQGVITVERVSDLPDLTDIETAPNLQGSFYYVKNVNILCVASGRRWVQINSDTTLVANDEIIELTDKNGSVIIDLGVSDSLGNNAQGSVELKPGKNIKFEIQKYDAETGQGNEITINGPAYELKTDEKGSIILTDGETESKLNIGAGEHVRSVTSNPEDGGIAINVENMYTTDFKVENLEHGYEFSLTDGQGNFKATINPQIHYGATKVADIVNNDITLDIYDREEVNRLVEGAKQDIDAMTYRGTVGDGGTAASSIAKLAEQDLHIGDTYKIITAEYYKEQLFRVGDLAIAQGTEVESVITPETLTFAWVPSAGSSNVAYTGFTSANNAFGVKERHDDGQDTKILDVQLSSGESGMIEVTSEELEQNKQINIKFDHKTSEVVPSEGETKTSNQGQDFEIPVDKVTYDEYGHISGVETTKYVVSKVTFPEAVSPVEAVKSKVSVDGGTASIDTIVVANQQDYSTATTETTVKIKSNNLTISSEGVGDAPAIAIDLEWGSF